jgi:hypothetical protein
MNTDTSDQLIAEYLAQLARAADRLPASRRAELLEQIGAHIVSARAAGHADDEAGIRTVLDRLGEPEDIVAAARDHEERPPRGAARPGAPFVALRQPHAVLEIAAFGMLTLGSFVLPAVGWLTGGSSLLLLGLPVGWLIGVVLLWSSRRLRLGEKLLATLVVPGGPGVLWLLSRLPAQVCSTGPRSPTVVGVDTDGLAHISGVATPAPTTCTGFAFPPAVGIPLLLFILIGPFTVGVLLLSRAVVRAAAEPPTAVRWWWGGREVAAVSLMGPGSLPLPVLAPIAGLVFMWSSPRWSRRHKTLASATATLPVTLVLLGYFALPAFDVVLPLLAAVIIGPMIAAAYLTQTVDRRPG